MWRFYVVLLFCALAFFAQPAMAQQAPDIPNDYPYLWMDYPPVVFQDEVITVTYYVADGATSAYFGFSGELISSPAGCTIAALGQGLECSGAGIYDVVLRVPGVAQEIWYFARAEFPSGQQQYERYVAVFEPFEIQVQAPEQVFVGKQFTMTFATTANVGNSINLYANPLWQVKSYAMQVSEGCDKIDHSMWICSVDEHTITITPANTTAIELEILVISDSLNGVIKQEKINLNPSAAPTGDPDLINYPIPCLIDPSLCQAADLAQELVISNQPVTTSATITVGESISMTWVISNTGIGWFGEPQITATLQYPWSEDYSEIGDTAMGPGQGQRTEFSVIPPVGVWILAPTFESSLPDPNLANNSAVVTVTVLPREVKPPCPTPGRCNQADVSQVITAPRTTLFVGESMTVTWLIANEGGTNVAYYGEPTVTGTLVSGIFTDPVGEWLSAGPATLAVGHGLVTEVSVTPPVGVWTLAPTFESSLSDPYPINDSATLTITVIAAPVPKLYLPLVTR